MIWMVAYFAARLILKHTDLPTWERVAVALIPIPFFAFFIWRFVTAMRYADELQRKIQLEALAIAFPLSVLLLMTLGLLQRAIDLPMNDWSYAHVWLYLPLLYALGSGIAARRYS